MNMVTLLDCSRMVMTHRALVQHGLAETVQKSIASQRQHQPHVHPASGLGLRSPTFPRLYMEAIVLYVGDHYFRSLAASSEPLTKVCRCFLYMPWQCTICKSQHAQV